MDQKCLVQGDDAPCSVMTASSAQYLNGLICWTCHWTPSTSRQISPRAFYWVWMSSSRIWVFLWLPAQTEGCWKPSVFARFVSAEPQMVCQWCRSTIANWQWNILPGFCHSCQLFIWHSPQHKVLRCTNSMLWFASQCAKKTSAEKKDELKNELIWFNPEIACKTESVPS